MHISLLFYLQTSAPVPSELPERPCTETKHLADFPSQEAVIVLVPLDTPVTTPCELTVATELLDDAQIMVAVLDASFGRTVA